LAREPASKQIKLGKSGQTADFICTTTLKVPVEPLPSQKAAITTILHRLPQPGRFADASRREQYVIVHLFPKLFCGSRDCYVAKKCLPQKAPPIPRLHINIPVDFWKNKPENYWKSLVEWLQLPGITSHFSPSTALKSLIPTAAWP
jgi:hypothetical protein